MPNNALITTMLRNQDGDRHLLGSYPGRLTKSWGDGDELKEFWNAGMEVSQVSRITFANPGTLPVGGKVRILIKEANCEEREIELHVCDEPAAVPRSLKEMLIEKINGVGTTLIIISGDLYGYVAAGVAGAEAVTITGQPGKKFTIDFGGFGITTGSVTTPAKPTASLVASAACAAPIYGGQAVVENTRLISANRPIKSNSSLTSDFEKLCMTPQGHITEEYIGWSLESDYPEMQFQECCEDLDCDEPLDCHRCITVVTTCCNSPLITLQFEMPPAGAVLPPSFIDQEVFYRRVAETGYNRMGRAALQLGATANPNLSAAEHNNFAWRVVDVVSLDKMQFVVGVR